MKNRIKKLRIIIYFFIFGAIFAAPVVLLYAEEAQNLPNGYLDIIRMENEGNIKEKLPIIFNPFNGDMKFVIKEDQFKVGDKFKTMIDDKEYIVIKGEDSRLTITLSD